MADYLKSKERQTKNYPVEALNTSGLMSRVEPFLTPELLKSRYLHGVDLNEWTDDELKQEILLAANEFELISGLNVFPVQFKERFPYDANLYKNFLHFKTNHGPINSVELIQVESSDYNSIYNMPPDWVEMGLAHRRQINLLPILTVFGTSGTIATASPSGALIFLQALTNFRWLPAFWSVTYTAGLCKKDGHIPIIVNDVIGMMAAIELLSTKQNQFLYNSESLAQDGISQSTSGAGPQTYQPRIDHLEQRKEKMMAKIKSIFFSKYFVSNI